MTDLPTSSRPSFKLPTFGQVSATLRSGDIALSAGVMGLILILIVPLPAILVRHL